MIRVGFSTLLRNPLSWLIRRVTGAPYSHVWLVVFDSALGRDMVIEAGVGGLHVTPLARFQRTNTVVELMTPAYPLDAGLRTMSAAIGRDYDYAGLVGMLVVAIERWLKMKARNPFRGARSLFCSEFVARVMVASGYPGADAIDPDSASPKDLRALLS